MKNPFKKKEPTPPSNPIADRLDEVVAFITEHGWTQGSWYDSHTGKVCVEGAMLMVAGLTPQQSINGGGVVLQGEMDDLYIPALKALNDCIREDTNGRYETALAFNDSGHMTEEELLDEVRRCADRQRAQGAEAAS